MGAWAKFVIFIRRMQLIKGRFLNTIMQNSNTTFKINCCYQF